jgi:ribosomal protein S18 acetylase RimI-like enzyme
VRVRKALWAEHKAICQLAKLSPFSRTFLDIRFIQEYYVKGEVLVAEDRGKLVGFICVRHCVRKPHTSVYDMGVAVPRQGVGAKLLEAVEKASPWKRIRLISEKANSNAGKFYTAMGFKVTGAGENKQGEPYWILEKQL